MKGKKKNLKKGIKPIKVFLLVIAVVLITAGTVSLIYSSYNVIEYEEYPIYLQVTEVKNVGFDIKSDALSFGKIPQGGRGTVELNLNHNYKEPLLITMTVKGKAKEFIELSENNFILEPGVTEKVEVYASIPENQSLGEYNGKLEILFKKVNI